MGGVRKATLAERSNGAEISAQDVFGATLASAGLLLPEEEGAPATLSRDITAFGRCCFKAFNRKEEAVTAFVEGFEEYVSHHSNLLRCLKPWVSTRDGAPGARSFYAQQDTLVKLLLGVDHVQTQVLECLVGKMAEHAEDTEADAGESVPRLCLSQIRWLDRVKDCPKLVASLLEVMSLLDDDMQREIIECFPEIIDDRQHDDVVESLLEQMDANSALLPPVLDALSNLNLDTELLATVQRKVMPKLKSAELQVLPLLVKFLLQTAGVESTSVLSHIRDLDVTALRVGAGDDGDDTMRVDRASAESLVIDSLRGGFRCNFAVTHVVLKELEKTEKHTAMDVWMFLVLHSLPGHRLKVQAICRKKAKKGVLTAETVRRAVAASHSALREYFSDALQLAGTLTRDANPMPRRCGTAFYHTLFMTFEEDFHRQEILQGLITHTGSASAREVDCALQVARELSEKEPHAADLRRHLQFVQNIMDYMEAFTDEQIRTLYTIFANLSLSAMRSTGSMPMDDQIHILLRKQLGHPDAVYKRMGILGATAMVACFGAVQQTATATPSGNERLHDSAAAETSACSISAELLKYIEDMLEMVFTSCTGQPGCLAFAYDELALAFEHSRTNQANASKIDDRILNNIFERASEDFEGGYLLDLGENGELLPAPMPDLSLKSKAWMNLDQMNAVIILNVMPLAASAVSSEREQLTILCSLFRLLVSTTRLTSGSVEDIDAVLGCPLYMMAAPTSAGGEPTSTECYDSVKIFDSTFRTFFSQLPRREKELVTKCVFVATNWTRELLNGFCLEVSNEMKVKTRQRLRDLVGLERKLDICLEIHPNANLPNLNQPLSAMMSDGGLFGQAEAKKRAPKKRRAAKSTVENNAGAGDEGTQSGHSPVQSTSGMGNRVAADGGDGPRKLSHYNSLGKPLMRELLLCSSLMLAQTEDLVRIHEDTETQEPVEQLISLVKEPRLMHYLLVELLDKVKFITRKADKSPAFAGSGVGGSGSARAQHGGCFPGLCRLDQRTAVTTLMPVLKSLRQHLVDLGEAAALLRSVGKEAERISDVDYDDEESMSEADAQYYADSIMLLAQCLHELLRCEDLHTVEANRVLLCQVLRSLAKYPEHLDADYADPLVFAQAAYDAFTFVEGYAAKHNQKNFAVASEFIPLLTQINSLASEYVEDADQVKGLLVGKEKLSTRLSSLAGLFLETPWGEIKKLNKDSLSRMLRVHLSQAKDPVEEMAVKLRAVQDFQASEKRNKLSGKGSKGSVDTAASVADERGEAILPTLNSATLSIYIKTLMEEVPAQLSRLSDRALSREATVEQSLDQMKTVIGFFKAMLSMTRVGGAIGAKLQGNSMLKALLRTGKSVVDLFSKKWLPLLEKWFVSHQSQITEIIKAFQKGTRQLQIICSHGKTNQEISIAALVPATKKSLEAVIYRVKLMLEKVGDGYASAFEQGNLKHRELDGREVSSQQEAYGSESDESDDDDDDDEADDQ